MSDPELPGDVWVPVSIPWRWVVPGDVFVGSTNGLWHVIANTDGRATAQRGPLEHSDTVDPDETVDVLVPVPEADAVALLREELGARVIARRATG